MPAVEKQKTEPAPGKCRGGLGLTSVIASGVDQWWKRRMPVKAIAIPYLSAVSITLSSRMDPPG